jgi:hypothetical protein
MLTQTLLLSLPAVALGGVLLHAALQSRARMGGPVSAAAPAPVSRLGQGGGDRDDEIDGVWSRRTYERVRGTYVAYGVLVAVTTAVGASAYVSDVAAAVLRSQQHSWVYGAGLFAVLAGSYVGARVVKSSRSKVACAALLTTSLGLALAPVCYLGGPLVVSSLVLTAATALPLCTVATLSPSGSYLFMNGPLAMGLGALVAVGQLSWFFPGAFLLRVA